MNRAGNEVTIAYAGNYVTHEEARSLRAYVHQPGSVAFAKIGVALTTNRRRLLTTPVLLDNNMMSAEPISGALVGRFGYYLLCTVDFNEVSSGSALPYLTVGGLSDIKVSVPPADEQREIAAVLGTLD